MVESSKYGGALNPGRAFPKLRKLFGKTEQYLSMQWLGPLQQCMETLVYRVSISIPNQTLVEHRQRVDLTNLNAQIIVLKPRLRGLPIK